MAGTVLSGLVQEINTDLENHNVQFVQSDLDLLDIDYGVLHRW